MFCAESDAAENNHSSKNQALASCCASKQVTEASKYSVGLQLSGHTHGGQVFPYHVLAYLDQVGGSVGRSVGRPLFETAPSHCVGNNSLEYFCAQPLSVNTCAESKQPVHPALVLRG